MKLLPVAALSYAFCLALLFLHTESTQPPFSCDSANPQTKLFPFCQTKLPIRKRVQDLVSRLTLDEKISQLVNSAPAIPRLGVPPYEWWSEALHGVSGYGYGVTFNGRISSVTSFPQVLLTAATFDSHLWYRIGQVKFSTPHIYYYYHSLAEEILLDCIELSHIVHFSSTANRLNNPT